MADLSGVRAFDGDDAMSNLSYEEPYETPGFPKAPRVPIFTVNGKVPDVLYVLNHVTPNRRYLGSKLYPVSVYTLTFTPSRP